MTTDPITRLNAALEGRYRVERELGEGGMATVYLAEDLRHERKVALKVLKPELAAVVGAERFLTEIKTTANLQHPHILALFDSGQAESFLYYVMPYVEGDNLREKLDRERQLSVDEALQITKAVASALQYAHDRDVIHRDIKPENILLHAGEPVVADFGIALALSAAGGGRMTETGLSLGTPHYMSPEQATADRDLSARSDVYSLACVLYEMLAGDPPHTGPTAQAILMRILTEEPRSVTDVRKAVPPHVQAVLVKALEKLPADRFESAEQFSGALENESFTYVRRVRREAVTASSPVMPAPTAGVDRRVFAVATAVLALLAAWGWMTGSSEPERGALWTSLDLGEVVADPFGDVIVAPDGSAFATAGQVDGETALYARRAGEARFRRPPGTEEARYPTFSPDGEWIAYRDFSQNAILRVPLDGGTPLTILPDGVITNPYTLNSGDDGTIVFMAQGGLYRIAGTGGEPEQLLEGGGAWRFPRLLPGGSSVLLTEVATLSIAVLDLEADTLRQIIPEGVDATYVDTGHIVYAHPNGGLFAAPFDLNALDVTGPSVPVLDDVSMIVIGNAGIIRARYSISQNGTLVYGAGGPVASGPGGGQRLVIVDLEGNEEPLVLAPRPIPNLGASWSPDGESVVFTSGGQIYTYNVSLGTTPRQLTFEGANNRAVYSPDGTRVAFSSAREGTDGRDLFVKDLNDDSPPRSIITLDANQDVMQWPSDTLIVFERVLGGNGDLWMVNLSDPDSARAEPYLTAEANLRRIAVSPDGSLAAYRSNESGANEIYIRSFPDPGERTLVSQGGGFAPNWSPDGNTLYYVTGFGQPFMAARMQRDPVPVVLSTDTTLALVFNVTAFPGSALHPDGDRFIFAQNATAATLPEDGAAEPLRFLVVTNWFEELRQRMGDQ